jgi:hypothetical protein
MSPVFDFEEKTGDSGGFTGFLKYVFFRIFFKNFINFNILLDF